MPDVSIVTGSGRGIGKAVAERLASEGHDIMLFSRTERELKEVQLKINSLGVNCNYYYGDVADKNFVDESVKDILARYKSIDHLINNAGVGIFRKLVDADLSEFQQQINTNVYGMFNFCRAVLPNMIERKSGSIINIASLAGKNSFIGGTMYSASKHAVLGLARSLMLEVREYNIRVVTICPGSVQTKFGDHSEMNPISKSNILLPEDVAEVVADVIKLPIRALASEIDLRPTNPRK